MSGNALHSGRKRVTRTITWACLALIPALAIMTLGVGLLPALTGSDTPAGVPGGLQVADTRDLSNQGDDLAAVAPAATPDSLDGFMDNWQNTVRRRPSPRR
jgi:hypothetical protein